jgi:hypothetical protein
LNVYISLQTMSIEDAENSYSRCGSPIMLNSSPSTISAVDVAFDKIETTTLVERRLIPQSQSTMSLDTNLDSWDNTVKDDEDEENTLLDSNCSRSDNSNNNISESCCNAADESEDDGCIPFDYESEMEECSQYIFSAGPYSPAATAALAAAAAPSSSAPSCTARPDTPRDLTVAPVPCTTAGAASAQPACDPCCPQWRERQRRDNEAHHAGEHYAWQQAMKHAAASSPDQMRYALRSFVREACCRELQALRSRPDVSFVRMDVLLSESRTRSSMRASCMLASATSTAQRKARYIEVITEHWKALELRVEEMLAETEKESVATSENHLRSIGYALNALSLFSNDPAHIIRELNMAHVEEQRRQRHDREAQLLATLKTQGRLFMLPTLYAEEIEEPIPVIQIEEVLRPVEGSGEFTHPWQLLSPNASIYSLAPSSAPESVGELSPSLSCCTIPSEACTPTWRAAGPPTPSWKGMQPPRLPMLDLFMTAPAVVPSTVIADSETGVPYVMPVDPSYALHEMNRQEALVHTTQADALSSPQLSGAHVVRGAGLSAPAAVGGRLQPLVLDAAEDSWGFFAEEDMFDYAETMKLAEAEYQVLSFDLRETLTGTAATATTRATLTGG